MLKESLIDHLWEQRGIHHELALEAEENGYDVAREYHEHLAERYKALIETQLGREGGDSQ